MQPEPALGCGAEQAAEWGWGLQGEKAVLRAGPASETWLVPATVRGCSGGSSQGPGWGPELGPWGQQGSRRLPWRPERGPRRAGMAVPPWLRPRGLEHLDWLLPGPQVQRARRRRPGAVGGAAAGGWRARRAAPGAGGPRGPGRPSGLGPPADASREAAQTRFWAWAGVHLELVRTEARRPRCGWHSSLLLLGLTRSGRGGLWGGEDRPVSSRLPALRPWGRALGVGSWWEGQPGQGVCQARSAPQP